MRRRKTVSREGQGRRKGQKAKEEGKDQVRDGEKVKKTVRGKRTSGEWILVWKKRRGGKGRGH